MIVVVDFAQLKHQSENKTILVEYFQSKLNRKLEMHHNRLELPESNIKDAKLLVEKYLHETGNDNIFRVVSQNAMLHVVPANLEAAHKPVDKVKGIPPFPPLSDDRLPLMSVVYPNYSTPAIKWDKPLDKKMKKKLGH